MLKGRYSVLKGEIFSVEVKSFLKIIFYKTFIKPIKVLEKNIFEVRNPCSLLLFSIHLTLKHM